MKCSNPECSAEITKGSNFCPNCGTLLRKPTNGASRGVKTGDIGYFEGKIENTQLNGRASVGNVIFQQQTDSLVVCPQCGRRNAPVNTFNCRECSRDNLCTSHQDQETFICIECAKAKNVGVTTAGSPSAMAGEFCYSCSKLLRDDFFKCKNCGKLNCPECRDPEFRGWCLECGDEKRRLETEKKIEGLMKEGDEFFESCRWSDAIKTFSEVLNLDRENKQAKCQLKLASENAQKLIDLAKAESLGDFEKTLQQSVSLSPEKKTLNVKMPEIKKQLEEKRRLEERLGKELQRGDRYIKYASGVVFDTLTNLEWYRGPDADTNWHEAKKWAETLAKAGGGWRMPTLDELETLYKKGEGYVNITPLLMTTWGFVWSGETWHSSSALVFTFSGECGDCLNHYALARAFAVRSRR